MEINFTTFILEIINFLVLIWLLKRFFYQPVLNIVEKRQKNIQNSLKEAEEQKQKAKELERQYSSRLDDWQQEKSEKWAELRKEMDHEREKRLNAVQEEIKKAQDKADFLIDQKQQALDKQAHELAIKNASIFMRNLLKDFASAELTSRMLQKAIKDLNNLPSQKLSQLKNAAESQNQVDVYSAHELAQQDKTDLEQAFKTLLGEKNYNWQYQTDASLIAGVHIQFGPWVMNASAEHEFEFFIEAADETATA